MHQSSAGSALSLKTHSFWDITTSRITTSASTLSIFLNQNLHTATFQLPASTSPSIRLTMGFSNLSVRGAYPGKPGLESSRPFSASPTAGMFTICVQCHHTKRFEATIFVHAAAFLDPLNYTSQLNSREPLVVPWDVWGPTHTRWITKDNMKYGLHSLFGFRSLLPSCLLDLILWTSRGTLIESFWKDTRSILVPLNQEKDLRSPLPMAYLRRMYAPVFHTGQVGSHTNYSVPHSEGRRGLDHTVMEVGLPFVVPTITFHAHPPDEFQA